MKTLRETYPMNYRAARRAVESGETFHNTRFELVPGSYGVENVACILHGTAVITWLANDSVILNTKDANGKTWRSKTTKQRLNAFLPDGIFVFQQYGKWFVGNSGKMNHENIFDTPFFDGIQIHPIQD